jgi:hypothetical protein
MLPEGSEARICRGLHIGRIIGQRHQHCDDEGKRHAEPEDAIMEKYPGPLALEARPSEQAREEEEQRHQKYVLPCTKQIEAEPPRSVDDRKGAPEIRGRCRTGTEKQTEN